MKLVFSQNIMYSLWELNSNYLAFRVSFFHVSWRLQVRIPLKAAHLFSMKLVSVSICFALHCYIRIADCFEGLS